jgi:signal transduction histidine kinase
MTSQNVLAIAAAQNRIASDSVDDLRLRAIAASGLGAWCWDMASNTVQWDEACSRLFGAPEVSVCDFDTFFGLLHPDDRSATREAVIHAVENGREYDMIHRVVWPDGSVHWLRCKGAVDQHSMTKRLVGVSVEVTWIRRIQEVLRTNERLANAASMASSLAHEINNPLEIICNTIYLLDQSGLNGNQRSFLAAANDAYERINTITQQILTLSVRQGVAPQTIELSDSVAEVVRQYEPVAHARRVELKTECAQNVRFSCVDSDVQQILSILLENSIDSNSTMVSVRVRPWSDWRGGRRSGIRLVVADNGGGIPLSMRAMLFQPFTSSKERRGAGLGLWLCQTIIKRYGGSIRYRSSVEKGRSGTCFSVVLRPWVTGNCSEHPVVQRFFPGF